jgi:hypothetical protein
MSTLTLSMVGYLSDGTPIEVPITGTSDIPTLAEIEASTVLARQAKLDTVEARLTADRAAKLDRDIAHASDAATYRAVLPTDISGLSLTRALEVIVAAAAGKVSGAAGTSITIRSADDAETIITATVDQHGNRTAVTIAPE